MLTPTQSKRTMKEMHHLNVYNFSINLVGGLARDNNDLHDMKKQDVKQEEAGL